MLKHMNPVWKNSFPPKTGLPTEYHIKVIVSRCKSCERSNSTVQLPAVSLGSALVMDITTMYYSNLKTHMHPLFKPAFVKNM